jgi:hypothetical protein
MSFPDNVWSIEILKDLYGKIRTHISGRLIVLQWLKRKMNSKSQEREQSLYLCLRMFFVGLLAIAEFFV